MVGFWVASANSDNWEENLLDGVYLPPNSSVDISFVNSNNVEWWNFRVKDSSEMRRIRRRMTPEFCDWHLQPLGEEGARAPQ